MPLRKKNADGKRGRPRKDPAGGDPYTDYAVVSMSLPTAMLEEIAAFAQFAGKRRYRAVKRSEAIRSLVGFALATWRRKLKESGADGPPEELL